MSSNGRTGSLINELRRNSTQPEPEVGMGVTFLHWTDRTPGTVVEVVRSYKSGPDKGKAREILVVSDQYVITSGSTHDGSAQYVIMPTDPARVHEVRATRAFRNKKGRWVTDGGTAVSLGQRDAYYDPSF